MALASGSESGYDKENFYATNPDVNLIGPRSLGRFTDWDDSDIQEIEVATGPFIASKIRFGSTHPFGSQQDIYYGLYDVFEKTATVIETEYGPQVVPIEPLEDDESQTSRSQSEQAEAKPDSPD